MHLHAIHLLHSGLWTRALMLVSHPIACKAALIVVGTVMQVYDEEDFRVAVKRRTLTMVFTMVITHRWRAEFDQMLRGQHISLIDASRLSSVDVIDIRGARGRGLCLPTLNQQSGGGRRHISVRDF
jgi:hypothetical protein